MNKEEKIKEIEEMMKKIEETIKKVEDNIQEIKAMKDSKVWMPEMRKTILVYNR